MFAMFRKLYIQILIVVEFLAKRRRILIELRNRLQGILDHTKNSAIDLGIWKPISKFSVVRPQSSVKESRLYRMWPLVGISRLVLKGFLMIS